MPRVDPAEFLALPLEAFPLLRGFDLHDVWRVELPGAGTRTLGELRALLTSKRRQSLPAPVRALFAIRSAAGRLFRLESVADDRPAQEVARTVPERLANASQSPPGTPAGPFATLYVLPAEAAYQALNATVHAILVVALVQTDSGQRLFWATYLRPVGRITSIYMGLIDPFRRTIVYPGLERWLQRALTRRS